MGESNSYPVPQTDEAESPNKKRLLSWIHDEVDQFGQTSETERRAEARLYSAPTIHYNGTLLQTGCSPNYLGEIWSLACCKHAMRSSNTFEANFEPKEDDTLYPTAALFIFTLARISGGYQYLASVARVTHGFRTMRRYAEFLRESHHKVKLSKLSDRSYALGDCHWDPNKNRSINPPAPHPHHEEGVCGGSSLDDNSGEHIICVSEHGAWLSWSKPTIVFNSRSNHDKPLKRAPHGRVVRTVIRNAANGNSFSTLVGDWFRDTD